MTRDQLLREVCRYAGHWEWCDSVERSYLKCTCGWDDIYRQVQDALATERTETSDGDDDGN